MDSTCSVWEKQTNSTFLGWHNHWGWKKLCSSAGQCKANPKAGATLLKPLCSPVSPLYAQLTVHNDSKYEVFSQIILHSACYALWMKNLGKKIKAAVFISCRLSPPCNTFTWNAVEILITLKFMSMHSEAITNEMLWKMLLERYDLLQSSIL